MDTIAAADNPVHVRFLTGCSVLVCFIVEKIWRRRIRRVIIKFGLSLLNLKILCKQILLISSS
ncbi:hypothetical protein Plhal304r1_c014g0053051 [Plasmopara halstedii]